MTVVSVEALEELFWDFFASINKIFILAGRICTNLLFYGV